eukprot:01302.XXX_3284_2631_1 [CDS] Oithona nana genome sequencing.
MQQFGIYNDYGGIGNVQNSYCCFFSLKLEFSNYKHRKT